MKSFKYRFLSNPRVTIGLTWLVLVLIAALFAQYISPGNPFEIVGKPFSGSGPEHWLGTDSLGRDVLAGMIHGARTTLMIAVFATLAAVVFGTAVGAIAGYFGGWVDDVLMRATEIFQTIPSFLFAIVLIAILSPSAFNLVVAIATVSWPPIARVVRGEVLSVKAREYVQAAVVAGQTDSAILLRQVLPNTLSPLIVTGSLMVATAILVESALSFLGLGAPNQMSWGFMVGAARSFLRDAWWLVTLPGLTIMLTVLAINLVGEGLNDALNPRLADL
jgi:peptide/nickel transport system permease protein